MSINIQELVNFKVNGLNEMLTEAQKHQLINYQEQLRFLHSELADVQSEINKVKVATPVRYFQTVDGTWHTRKLLAVDVDYTLEQKARIFLHGKSNYKLWFLNKANKLCIVDDNKIIDNNLYLMIMLDVKGYKKQTRMSLDRFLHLIELGEFSVVNKKFIHYYLKPYNESNCMKKMIEHLEAQEVELKKKIDAILNNTFYKSIEKLYQEKQDSLTRKFYAAAKDITRDVEAEKATKKKAKCEKSQAAIKNLWDSVVTEAEKAYFIGWLCSHVDNIYIKVVNGGVSDKVISASYPDAIYGNKYREKANSSGWDASSGKIRFTNIEYAPTRTIEALATLKHISRSANKGNVIFKNRTLSNLDLCLFILGKYQKYGFKSGIKGLHKLIDYETLCSECFAEYSEEFMSGFQA